MSQLPIHVYLTSGTMTCKLTPTYQVHLVTWVTLTRYILLVCLTKLGKSSYITFNNKLELH